MKNIISVLIVISILFSVSSCGKREAKGDLTTDHTLRTTEEESSSDPMQLMEDMQETTENGTAAGIRTGTKPAERIFFGSRTGTDKTCTGLEPLPMYSFESADMTGRNDLPKDSISHSFGVASGEKPHEISVKNQKFFDEKGYDAICYDSKSTSKKIYLTFDCGYENGYTSKILDVLKEKNVKAAFFCTLSEVKSNHEIIARMINEGHIVGNHSVTHPDFSSLTRKEMYDEVKGFDDYMREKFGYSSFYFRYPQGKYNEDSLYFLNSMGYKCVFWSLAYADWDLNSQKGADYAIKTVTERLHPGAVLLLHAVSPDNAEGLDRIIDTARDMGYEFCSPDKL